MTSTTYELLDKLLGSSPFNPSKREIAVFSYDLHTLLFSEFEELLRALRAGQSESVQKWYEARLQNLAKNDLITEFERDAIQELLSSMLGLKELTLRPEVHSKLVHEAERLERSPYATNVGAVLAGVARSSADRILGAPPSSGGSPMGVILVADVAGAIGVASIGKLAVVLVPWAYAGAIALGGAICSAAAAW